MAEQKKQPELFKANLFSSPGPGPAAGGLSFGLTTDSFNSSFSLAPALTPVVPAASPPAAKKQGLLQTTPSSGPLSHAALPAEVKVTPPATSPATSTPAVKSTPIYSMATPTPAAADEVELSTVPLDSPPPPTSSSPAGCGLCLTCSLTHHTHRPLLMHPPHTYTPTHSLSDTLIHTLTHSCMCSHSPVIW